MLVFCAVVFVALIAVMIFLNRARGQAPSASPAPSISMTTPSSTNQAAAKPSADELKKKLTPEQYRERYNLKADYPMVAESYSEARREMAHRIGLGQKGRQAKAAAAAPAPKAKRAARVAEPA